MGTRSLTKFQQENGKEIVVMYRQFDGYPEGHGAEIAEFLAPMRLCNGIGAGQSAGQWANGMGCLAAQTVAKFKNDIGGIYLHAAGDNDCWQDFNYIVKPQGEDGILFVVQDSSGAELFSGTPRQFLDEFLTKAQDEQ